MVKTTVALTIDAEIWAAAKARFDNVSKVVNEFLKDAIGHKEKPMSVNPLKLANEQEEIKKKMAELSVRNTAIQAERDKIKRDIESGKTIYA